MSISIANRAGARPVPTELSSMNADELFGEGFDTFDIAAHFQISEAEAQKNVTILRTHRLFGGRPARLSA